MAETADAAALALAIPAYNEADGITEFLVELDGALERWDGPVRMFVVDDASTDDTRRVLDGLATRLTAELHVETNDVNSGHGPTALRAYALAVGSDAEFVLQVDGDGQFDSEQFWDLYHAMPAADVAAGVRRSRTDPWFRKVLSAMVRAYLKMFFGVARRDPNCPFRLYRASALRPLLEEIDPAASVPTIYLSVLESKRGLRIAEVEVRHRVRRGDSDQGTTWGTKRRALLIPRRLLRFVWSALIESVRFRAHLRKR